MSESKAQDSIEKPALPPNPYEMYVVCKSNIDLTYGDDPDLATNHGTDFYVGDIFQGKVSRRHPKFIMLRAASKTNKRQWLALSEKTEQQSVMRVFPAKLADYYHLSIGETASAKCMALSRVILSTVDETYQLHLASLSREIVMFLPFSYPVFTASATLFRGRGHFSQFCVPYFHTKGNCREYLSRLEELRRKTVSEIETSSTNSKNCDDSQQQNASLAADRAYEKKLMTQWRNRLTFEEQNDPEVIAQRAQMTEDEKEDEAMELEDEALADAEYLNQIVSVQKGALPAWVTGVYESIPRQTGYYYSIELYFIDNDCSIPFEKDEYLEQNKYAKFAIQNMSETVDGKREWGSAPRLVAYKVGQELHDMIEVNDVSGSRWFDVEFNPEESVGGEDECAVMVPDVDVLQCRVGGKFQGDAKSRHYIDVKDKNGDIFEKWLPMLVINLVL